MADLIAKSHITAVIGLGQTGLSVARFLAVRQQRFILCDTRDQLANLDALLQEFPGVHIETGPLNAETLLAVDELVVSPGVPLREPAIQAALNAGVSVVGDIGLFLREITAPIVAITGANAKSTVTSLVGDMAVRAGINVAVGGNIGTPVLDLLAQVNTELYVLELSSFQLETIGLGSNRNLNAKVSTILNISEDHMDRYDSLTSYYLAKQRIYFGAETVVTNRADALTNPPLAAGVTQLTFGLNKPDRHGFGLMIKDGVEYLAHEFAALMPAADVRMPGRHNIENALAALALGTAAGIDRVAMLTSLREFGGLPHRCQWVADVAGVAFYNDSKGTNVGATLAALEGLRTATGKIVLIAGGVGKGADFTPLTKALADTRGLVVIGEDGDKIAAVADSSVTVVSACSMVDAVQQALAMAKPGDRVLLSPACASFDMFANYAHRGESFMAAVAELTL